MVLRTDAVGEGGVQAGILPSSKTRGGGCRRRWMMMRERRVPAKRRMGSVMPAFAPVLRCLADGWEVGEVVCNVCENVLGVVDVWKVVCDFVVVVDGGIEASYETGNCFL